MNIEEYKFYGLKSHDCDAFMKRLLSIAFHDLLPTPIWGVLIELNHFFKDLWSTVLHIEHMETLKKNIIEILYKLEKIFPLDFFNSMEHLLVHLA